MRTYLLAIIKINDKINMGLIKLIRICILHQWVDSKVALLEENLKTDLTLLRTSTLFNFTSVFKKLPIGESTDFSGLIETDGIKEILKETYLQIPRKF